MKFIKLGSRYYLDVPIVQLSADAEVAYLRSQAYAGDAETSGFIPEAVLPMLVKKYTPVRGKKVVTELLQGELWVVVPGGWLLPDWQDEQSELEALVRRRAADAERQRRHRQQGAQSRDASSPVSRDRPRDSHVDSLSRERDRRSELELETEEEEPTPLLADLSRRLSRNERATTTTRELAYWSKLAGGADLEVEIEAFLVKNMGRVLEDPPGAWIGWLRAAARRAADDQQQRPVPACDRCHSTGWDGEDGDGRPRRCGCRTVTPITSAPSAGVA